MTKKSFRPGETKQPDYPRLLDLERGSLRSWGLAAVGGLLLGGAACTQAQGETVAPKADESSKVQKSPHAQKATTSTPPAHAVLPDAGAVPSPTIPMPGAPPPQRIEDKSANTPSAAVPKANENAKAKAKKPTPTKPPVDRATLAGKMRMPRLDEKKSDAKKTD
jgi:hypothetical protein